MKFFRSVTPLPENPTTFKVARNAVMRFDSIVAQPLHLDRHAAVILVLLSLSRRSMSGGKKGGMGGAGRVCARVASMRRVRCNRSFPSLYANDDAA
jgi:hypothetical protein